MAARALIIGGLLNEDFFFLAVVAQNKFRAVFPVAPICGWVILEVDPARAACRLRIWQNYP
jgi:hypothetical protein